MKPGANRKTKRRELAVVSLLLASALLMLSKLALEKNGFAYAQTQEGSAYSARAFLAASQVLLHPRCVNCHPGGDHPLVGDQSHPHPMNIERGPDGMGTAGLRCSGCHQDKNLSGEHSPPGAPEWHLPTPKMPMIFQNRTPQQICEHLKDPSQNGGRNLDQIIEHVQETPLVLWGWNPGGGRTPVPISHDDFLRDMTDWVRNGAACPK